MEQRVIAIAEQLGRIAGTAQAKTDAWLDQPAFREQLARIRDSAATLLDQISKLRNGRAVVVQRPPRSGGKVDAPGKKHRTPPPSIAGVKHSEQAIAKAKAARQAKRSSPHG